MKLEKIIYYKSKMNLNKNVCWTACWSWSNFAMMKRRSNDSPPYFEVLNLLFFLFLALSDSRSLSWIAVNGKSSILAYHPQPLNPISRFGRNFNIMKLLNIFEYIFFRYKTKTFKRNMFFSSIFFILTFKVFFPP